VTELPLSTVVPTPGATTPSNIVLILIVVFVVLFLILLVALFIAVCYYFSRKRSDKANEAPLTSGRNDVTTRQVPAVSKHMVDVYAPHYPMTGPY